MDWRIAFQQSLTSGFLPSLRHELPCKHCNSPLQVAWRSASISGAGPDTTRKGGHDAAQAAAHATARGPRTCCAIESQTVMWLGDRADHGREPRKATTDTRRPLSFAPRTMASEDFRFAPRAKYEHSRSKRGSAARGTHGAHMLSIEVARAAAHGPGRPVTKGTADAFRALNDSSNVRIKSARGNVSTDRRNDRVIIDALSSGGAVSTAAGARRAVQAYKGGRAATQATGNRTVGRLTDRIGELTVSTGRRGRPRKIKNMA